MAWSRHASGLAESRPSAGRRPPVGARHDYPPRRPAPVDGDGRARAARAVAGQRPAGRSRRADAQRRYLDHRDQVVDRGFPRRPEMARIPAASPTASSSPLIPRCRRRSSRKNADSSSPTAMARKSCATRRSTACAGNAQGADADGSRAPAPPGCLLPNSPGSRCRRSTARASRPWISAVPAWPGSAAACAGAC